MRAKEKIKPAPAYQEQANRVERIAKAVKCEIQQCVDRASEVLDRQRADLARAPHLRLVKVPR